MSSCDVEVYLAIASGLEKQELPPPPPPPPQPRWSCLPPTAGALEATMKRCAELVHRRRFALCLRLFFRRLAPPQPTVGLVGLSEDADAHVSTTTATSDSSYRSAWRKASEVLLPSHVFSHVRCLLSAVVLAHATRCRNFNTKHAHLRDTGGVHASSPPHYTQWPDEPGREPAQPTLRRG